MNEISKTLAKILFYALAAALLFWTASLTVAFVSAALPTASWFVPYFALVVFDVGMIAWMYVFLKHAQGTTQRAIALGLTAFDFIGVGLMVMAEILLGGQTLVAAPAGLGTWAIWGIGIWTVVNVGAIVAFHIGDPEAQKAMSIQNEKDAIWRGALLELASKRQTHSAMLTKELGGRLYNDLLAELFVDVNGNGVADIFEGNRPELPPQTAVPLASAAQPEQSYAPPLAQPEPVMVYVNGNGRVPGTYGPE